MSMTPLRGLTIILGTAITIVAMVWSAPTMAGKKPPSPSVDRPIIFWNSTKQDWAIRLTDVEGTSEAFFKVGGNLTTSGRARWSPNGQLIGGHNAYLGNSVFQGSNFGILVGTPDGASEEILVTTDEFHIWNLARPGVTGSKYSISESETCWLGNGEIVFPAITTYDASLFGGIPGDSVEARRLFVADMVGNIQPLTEFATFEGPTLSDAYPHWSPVLDKVVFVGSPTAAFGFGELYAINPDGTGLKQITNFGNSMVLYAPVWSPGGDQIVVLARDPATDAYAVLALDIDLSKPDPGTGVSGRVTYLDVFKQDVGPDTRMCWSADGLDIVFTRSVYDSRGRRTSELVAADAVTGAEFVIRRDNNTFIELPDWRPKP